ncbi:MAG: EpsG family protein [Clostridium sp.]|nr:EpsG family protein [Prevotella sp.]MCM1429146.1 EpsG family protein [Clostridium sp.]MCM1475326.1 EpsG family protein [Muribaculaceae bacterium]
MISGLRYRLGVDTIRYESAYADFPSLLELEKYDFSNTRYEPGFIIFCSITRTFSPDFVYLQLLHAFVVNTIVFLFTRHYCRNKFFVLTLYYVFLYLNFNCQVMRESLAVCIFLCSWPLIKKGKWLWYYVVAAVNILFHTSAIFMLLLPIFMLPGIRALFKPGLRSLFIIAAIIVGGFILQQMFFKAIVLMNMGDRLMDRASMYGSTADGGSRLNIFGAFSKIFRHILYPLVALIFMRMNWRHTHRNTKGKKPGWWKLEVLVMCGIYSASASIPINIFGRFFNYFGMFIFMVLGDWLFSKFHFKEKTYRLEPRYWALIFLPLFAYQLYAYNANANKSGTLKTWMQFYPYSSQLNPEDNLDREKIYHLERAR